MTDKVYQLLDESYYLPEGPARISIIEQAIREADTVGDTDAGYDARNELIDVATFSGAEEKALVAFSWCLARLDENPQNYDASDLLWRYKWIVSHLPRFPNVSLEQISSMEDDLERRYEAEGYSLRAVHYHRMSNAMQTGRFEEGAEHREKYKESKRDYMSDCPACERATEVFNMIRLKRDGKALQLAKPILSGKLACKTVPESTYGDVMIPYLRRGQLDEAKQCFETGYRLIMNSRDHLADTGRHLLFLVRTEQFRKAVPAMQRHLPWCVDTFDMESRFSFYSAAMTLCEALSKRKAKTRKFRLPAQLPCYRDDNTYVPAELADWFRQEAESLATQFNERNGNDYFTTQLAETREVVFG